MLLRQKHYGEQDGGQARMILVGALTSSQFLFFDACATSEPIDNHDVRHIASSSLSDRSCSIVRGQTGRLGSWHHHSALDYGNDFVGLRNQLPERVESDARQQGVLGRVYEFRRERDRVGAKSRDVIYEDGNPGRIIGVKLVIDSIPRPEFFRRNDSPFRKRSPGGPVTRIGNAGLLPYPAERH